MLNDVVNRKVHQTEIRLLIGLHKVSAKMVNGWEAIVVIRFREIIGKDRVALNSSRMIESYEEGGVDFVHRRLEQLLQQIQSPTTAYITTPLTAMDTSLRSRLCAIEQTAAPRRLLLKMQKLTLSVGHRPTNRAGSHVEADIIVARVVS